jgi:hypothetical protein
MSDSATTIWCVIFVVLAGALVLTVVVGPAWLLDSVIAYSWPTLAVCAVLGGLVLLARLVWRAFQARQDSRFPSREPIPVGRGRQAPPRLVLDLDELSEDRLRSLRPGYGRPITRA